MTILLQIYCCCARHDTLKWANNRWNLVSTIFGPSRISKECKHNRHIEANKQTLLSTYYVTFGAYRLAAIQTYNLDVKCRTSNQRGRALISRRKNKQFAIFRQTAGNFRQRRLCPWVLKILILPLNFTKTGFYISNFCIFGQQFSNKKNIFLQFSHIPKFRRGQLPPPPLLPRRHWIEHLSVQLFGTQTSRVYRHLFALHAVCSAHLFAFLLQSRYYVSFVVFYDTIRKWL